MDEVYYSISEFAFLCNVSAKTLRHYDKLGLLAPAYKDDITGYRYYTCDKVFDMVLIKGLKLRGFDLKEIKSYISEKNPLSLYSLYETRKADLLKEEERVKLALKRVTKRLSYFDEILQTGSKETIEIVNLEKRDVLCIRETIKLNKTGISLVCNKLQNKVVSANIKALSPLIIFYDGESFLEGNTISVEACSSVDKNSNDKRLLSSIYGGKYAKAFYKGSQFQLQLFYDKMILMLERMGLKHFKGLYIEYLLSFFHTKSFDDIVCNLYVQIDD